MQQVGNINREEITWAEQSAGKPRDDSFGSDWSNKRDARFPKQSQSIVKQSLSYSRLHCTPEMLTIR